MSTCNEKKQKYDRELAELKKFYELAKEDGVRSILESGIVKVNSKLMALDASKYKIVDRYHFDWFDAGESILIILYYEKVDSKKVEKKIEKSSFQIKLNDVEGDNYIFTVPKLNKDIIPEESKVEVNPEEVVISLVKTIKEEEWSELRLKKDKIQVGQK